MVISGTYITVVDNSGVRTVRSFGPGRLHRGKYSTTGDVVTGSVFKTYSENILKGSIVKFCIVNTVKPFKNYSGSSVSFDHNAAILWNSSSHSPLASRRLVPIHHHYRRLPNGSKVMSMATIVL